MPTPSAHSAWTPYKSKFRHPGAPMGMADIAEVLWRDYLNHNPITRTG
ncbi:hypothetical protein IC615_27345 [Serratia ureilytica]